MLLIDYNICIDNTISKYVKLELKLKTWKLAQAFILNS